jgi:hypothetical protein
MNNWCICWFFMHIFTGILIFKGLTALRLYKSFCVKGLNLSVLVAVLLAGKYRVTYVVAPCNRLHKEGRHFMPLPVPIGK